MKFVILLSVFALCYSTPLIFGNKMVNIDDDGTITVTGTDGRKMVITKVSNEVGPDIMKISVEDPFTSKKIMKIVNVGQDKESTRTGLIERLLRKWKGVVTHSDESNESDESTESDESSENVMRWSHRGQSGTDVLTEIFGQHQGVLDDETFQKILKRVNKLVRSGELDNSIYEVLKAFDENRPTSTRRVSSMFRPTGYVSNEGRSFLRTKTQEELKQKTGLNELRRAIFLENPQVSFYLYEGVPFAYRYTDILPNSGFDEELLQIIGDSQENNLELVPLQKMLQYPEYIPALMEYLRRSHQTTRFQSTQTQMFPELLERLSRIQEKEPMDQQQEQTIEMMKEGMKTMMEVMSKHELQEWMRQNVDEDDLEQFYRIVERNRLGTPHDVDEESQEEQRDMIRQMKNMWGS